MLGHRKNSSDPLYRLPILFLILSEAYVQKLRQGECADGDKDMNVHRSATNVSLHAFFCIDAFIILPARADVMQGLSMRNNTLLQFPLQPAVKKQGLCASSSLPAWLLLWKWTNWSAQTLHSHVEESTSPGRRKKIIRSWQEVGLGEGSMVKVEWQRMGEWWTRLSELGCSIVLIVTPTLFLPQQHLVIAILLSFPMVAARCTSLLAAERLEAPNALTHTQSSVSDIFQERVQLPVFPLHFPAPKWSWPPL